MVKKINLRTIIYFSSLLLLASCSQYDKLLKSNDYEKKYAKAIEYYEIEDYDRTIQLLDEVLPLYKGTEKAEKAYYIYAYAYYKQDNYLLAAYHFKNFNKTFPKSDKVEEVAYMIAYCYYKDSPEFSLDASNTVQAIKELQQFANTYPNSSRLSECNELIDMLRAKLEKKDFEIAKLYYNTEEYQAAVVSFKNILKNYPDTRNREEIMFLTFKSAYYLADKSVEKKKVERSKEVVLLYHEFKNKFPQSAYLKEAEKLYNDIQNVK